MSEYNDNSDDKQPKSKRRLVEIVRDAKIKAAERSDVVIDMKEADKARLELLLEALQSIAVDMDPDDDRFDLTLSNGLEPRLWIDSVAHVHMGRDRRTFRFVRDTRLGRVVLAESADLNHIEEQVSFYIADRIVERERILEGDLETFKSYYARMTHDHIGTAPVAVDNKSNDEDELISETRPPSEKRDVTIGATWFILGGIVGTALAVFYF